MIRMLLAMRVSGRGAPMFLRAMIAPWIVAAVATAFDLELAIYPAAILALSHCALWLRRPWVGSLLLILAAITGYRLIFSEATGLFQRAFTATSPDVLSQNVLYHLLFIGLSWIITLPLVLRRRRTVSCRGTGFSRSSERSRRRRRPGPVHLASCLCGNIPRDFRLRMMPYGTRHSGQAGVECLRYDRDSTDRFERTFPGDARRLEWPRYRSLPGGQGLIFRRPSIRGRRGGAYRFLIRSKVETIRRTMLSRDDRSSQRRSDPTRWSSPLKAKHPLRFHHGGGRNWLSSSTGRDEGNIGPEESVQVVFLPGHPARYPPGDRASAGQQVRRTSKSLLIRLPLRSIWRISADTVPGGW